MKQGPSFLLFSLLRSDSVGSSHLWSRWGWNRSAFWLSVRCECTCTDKTFKETHTLGKQCMGVTGELVGGGGWQRRVGLGAGIVGVELLQTVFCATFHKHVTPQSSHVRGSTWTMEGCERDKINREEKRQLHKRKFQQVWKDLPDWHLLADTATGSSTVV